MKFAIAPEHLDYFQRERAIAFTDLLTEKQIQVTNDSIEEVLAERLSMPRILTCMQPELVFRKGRDLWRSHNELKKTVLNSSLAGVAGELLGHRPLRLGYDQLYIGADTPYFDRTASLKEISSLQGVLGGYFLCLEGDDEERDELLPTKVGSGLFVDADFPIPFPELTANKKNRYFLIVYTHSMTAYIHKKDDPHTAELSKWGYGIGDPLTNHRNPIVYR